METFPQPVNIIALHSWRAYQSLHVEFVMDKSGSGASFSQGSPVFPCHKFHFTAFSILMLFHMNVISFYPPL